jgi:hypothetical protein
MAKVKFVTNDGRQTEGAIEIHHYTGAQRVERALKILAIFWGIALPCILIPFLHFFLVPGFTIVGVVMAVRLYSVTESLSFGVSQCPACSKELHLPDMDRKAKMKVLCPDCRYQLRLEF